MKNLFLFIFCSSLFFACDEVGPLINLNDITVPVGLTDTTYVSATIATPQSKSVLIEEFTGVHCSNCPQGHTLTSDLSALYPNRIVTLSIHSEFLANPYSFSTQDLRNQEAESISALFNIPGAKPIAMIDRKIYPSETELYYFTSKWSGYVGDQVANASAPVNIELSKVYDPTSRTLNVTMKIHYTQEVTAANKFSIALTESEIVSAQLMPNLDVDTFYVHDEVFRDFITPVAGITITTSKEAGRTIIKEFKTVLDPIWNADHMEIVAFVHETGNSEEVYQVTRIEVKD